MTPELTLHGQAVTLKLGPCSAQLSLNEALQLRHQIAQQLARSWAVSPQRQKERQRQLERRLEEADLLVQLEASALQAVLQAYPREHLVPLLRVFHHQRPLLSKKILSLLSKRSRQHLANEIKNQPPSPLHQVLLALALLQKTCADQGFFTGLWLKAKDYLQQLARLSEATLDAMAVRLDEPSRQALQHLASQLGVLELHRRLNTLQAYAQLNRPLNPSPLKEEDLTALLGQVSRSLKAFRATT